MSLTLWLNFDTFLERRSVAPVVCSGPVFASCKTPSHRIRCFQKCPNCDVIQRRFLETKPMETKVWPFQFDSHQDIEDFLRQTIPLTDRANPNPHPRSEPVTVHANMPDVIIRRISLEDWKYVTARIISQQRVIPFYGKSLMVKDCQPSFLQNERLAHIILGYRSEEIATILPSKNLVHVLLYRHVFSISEHMRKRARIHNPVTHQKVTLTPDQPIDADESRIDMPRVGRLV